MTSRSRLAAALLLASLASLASLAPLHAATDRFTNVAVHSHLPQGPGLAARFKADSGISTNSVVIFADDFESGELGARWDEKGAGKGKALSLAPADGEA
jgi:hypothetical protein